MNALAPRAAGQPVGPPVGVALAAPLAGEPGAVGPAVPGVVVGPVLLVGSVVGAGVDDVGEPVEGVLGVLGTPDVEPEFGGVEGIELGEELLDPDGVGVGVGVGVGFVPSLVLPPGFSVAGWLFEPPP